MPRLFRGRQRRTCAKQADQPLRVSLLLPMPDGRRSACDFLHVFLVSSCKGSSAQVHPECLRQWIDARTTPERLRCEVCHSEYR